MNDEIMELRQQHIGKLQDQTGYRTVFCQRVQAAGRYQGKLVFRECICFISKGDRHVIGQRCHNLHKTVPVHGKVGIVMSIGYIDGHIMFKVHRF